MPIRQSNANFHPKSLLPLEVEEAPNLKTLRVSRLPLMSHVDSSLPLNYLIRFFEKNMASQGNHERILADDQRRSLGYRLLLEEQQRRLETRKRLMASYRTPICPYSTVSGHSDCWFCLENGLVQPSNATDTLLRSLTRPQFQVDSRIHSVLIDN